MKKLLAGIAVFCVAVFGAMANVEMDLNLYATPLATYDLGNDTEMRPNAPFGFEDQFGFYFVSPTSWLDVGLALSDGFDFNVGVKQYYDGDKVFSDDDAFGFSGYLTLGPTVRFNLGDMHSFFVSTGLGGTIFGMKYETTSYDYYGDEETEENLDFIFSFDYNLDLGYRIWLVNKTGFHFGFDVGYDLTVPLALTATNDDYKDDLEGGSKHKIYFGVAFNFGDKSPDKF